MRKRSRGKRTSKEFQEWPVSGRRKIMKISGAYYVAIPREWLKAHGINPRKGTSLTVIGDKHLLVVNPKFEKEIVAEVMGIVKRAFPRIRPRKSAMKKKKTRS
jgi:bifunctional DNA-binding transcriptional regulator/antitoxin component of YhaV-PrlF toxin-antitoxin module